MKFDNKKVNIIVVVLFAIVLLSTTGLVLAINGVFDNSKTQVSRDKTNVILQQDENNEKLVHVYLGMADEASIASFQVGLDIDVVASAVVDFNWSNDLKENILKRNELSGEDSDKRLNLYYVGTKELNTNTVDEIEIGTIEISIPNDEESQLVIAPNEEFTKTVSIGHNKSNVTTESTDILVANLNKKEIPLEKIELDITDKVIDVNDVFNLSLTYTPDETTEDKTIKWYSSDDTIAMVDYRGAVTGLSEGIAYIYAEVGDLKVSCKVTVKAPRIELQKIELNKAEVALTEGQKEELSVRYIPDGVIYEGTLTWESSNENVATVNNGEVIAVGPGETTITVTATENGNTYTATCKVVVEKLQDDTILIDENDFDLSIGHTRKLNVIGDGVEGANVTWESSDSNTISVDENGVVTALKEGKATITAKVNGKEVSIEVTSVFKEVKAVQLKVEKDTLKLGETTNFEISVLPEDASLPVEYTITSSDSNIVDIDENGQLVAKGVGKAIITVKTANGAISQIEITVTEKSNGPDTGDIAVYALLVILAISIIGIVFVLTKKAKASRN